MTFAPIFPSRPPDAPRIKVEFKTVRIEVFRRRSRWARFKDWFRTRVLGQPEPESVAEVIGAEMTRLARQDMLDAEDRLFNITYDNKEID